MKIANVTVYILSTLILLACSGQKSKGADNVGNTIEDNGTSNDVLSAKGTEKLNMLVEVFNSFSTSSYKSFDGYVASFGDNPEKFIKHKNWYGGVNVNQYTSKTINSLDEATEINIYSELDPLILAYQKTAKELIKVLNESYSYFDMKDYDSDNFAKAKENHKNTLDAYSNFFIVDAELRDQSDSIQRELEMIYLNKLKEEGETLNYLVGMAINTSERMLNISQAAEYEKLNAVELEKAHEEVRLIFDELTQFKIDKPDEFDADHNMSWFYSAFKDFTKSSKELCNRKKENRPFSRGEKMNLNPSSGWMVSGSTYDVLKKYNNLINRYNSMVN